MEKDKHGSSDLYSLEDFNDLFDNIVDDAYLEGRFGGVPQFKGLFSLDGE